MSLCCRIDRAREMQRERDSFELLMYSRAKQSDQNYLKLSQLEHIICSLDDEEFAYENASGTTKETYFNKVI